MTLAGAQTTLAGAQTTLAGAQVRLAGAQLTFAGAQTAFAAAQVTVVSAHSAIVVWLKLQPRNPLRFRTGWPACLSPTGVVHAKFFSQMAVRCSTWNVFATGSSWSTLGPFECKRAAMSSAALIAKAWEARSRAYAPYSGFAVGAALEAVDGTIFTGCNVENLSFGLTICAERVAVGAAVASGVREFRRLAIVSDSKDPVSPCGACRQVLAEFTPEIAVISENRAGQRFSACLSELLPRAKTGILDSVTSPECST